MTMKTSIMGQPVNNKMTATKVPKTLIKPRPSSRSVSGGNKSPNASPRKVVFDSTTSKSVLTKRITMSSSPSKPGLALAAKSSLPATTVLPKTATASNSSDPMKAFRSVWYLGGNQMIKLLTSVDGDLDHAVLANIADVPAVVGDLALSVESLVSDDVTIGGFEMDILAKIASNTLAAKHAPMDSAAPSAAAAAPQVTDDAIDNDMPQLPSPSTDAVPNPLATYQPVPNPLARITPPSSPLPSTELRLNELPTPNLPVAMLDSR